MIGLLNGGSTPFASQAYVWGSRIDELIRFSRNLGSSWQHFHPQQDHQDSVDVLVAADGTPKEKYEYDPFGGVTVFTWNGSAWTSPSSVSPLGNPYTYTGRRLDPETGLMYYRNRYYWSAVGRFLTCDPLGPWGDVYSSGNAYTYGGNTPPFLLDPLGHQVGEGGGGGEQTQPPVPVEVIVPERTTTATVSGVTSVTPHPGNSTTREKVPPRPTVMPRLYDNAFHSGDDH